MRRQSLHSNPDPCDISDTYRKYQCPATFYMFTNPKCLTGYYTNKISALASFKHTCSTSPCNVDRSVMCTVLWHVRRREGLPSQRDTLPCPVCKIRRIWYNGIHMPPSVNEGWQVIPRHTWFVTRQICVCVCFFWIVWFCCVCLFVWLVGWFVFESTY